MKRYVWTPNGLAAGLACAALMMGGAPLYAAEVIEHSFPSAGGGTPAQPAAAPQAQPAAAPQAPASPQTGSLEDRVARLEHMLDSGTLVDMLSQVQQMQEELQTVRGELEVQRHDLDTLQQHQRDLYVDIDRRLRALEVAKAGQGSTQAAGAAALPASGTSPPNNGAPQLPNATPQLPNATPQLPNATPQLPNPPPPATGTGPAPTVNPPPSGTAAGTDSAQVQTQYEQAFNLLRGGQYGDAITSFQQFLSDHPQGPLSDNALYWLGEAEYVTRQYPSALKDFQGVVTRFPGSGKVPDAQLKVGFTYYEMGKWDDARKALDDLAQKYPDTSAAKLAQNRLQKMRAEGH